jgi:nitrite reductase/ring-hydroxylating ferredoxin subunit
VSDADSADAARAFHRACAAADVVEGEGLPVTIGAREVLVCRFGGRIYALENRCSHRDEKLSGGRIRRGQIMCPAHGARFDLKTGASYSDQLTRTPICVFETRFTAEGDVEVLL